MKSRSVSDWLFYGFSLPSPQKAAEVFGFFAVMLIVMLALYFFGSGPLSVTNLNIRFI